MTTGMIPAVPNPALRCAVFEASGNFTIPAETLFITMIGGGGRAAADALWTGGSGEVIYRRKLTGQVVGAVAVVTVGAGATAAYTAGGASSFNGSPTAAGGSTGTGGADRINVHALDSTPTLNNYGSAALGGIFGAKGAGRAGTAANNGMVMIEW